MKRFVLVGIFLFSSYLGFAQTAVFKIVVPQDLVAHDVVLELEYYKISDSNNMVNVVYISPDWNSYTENGETKYYSIYHLTGLECGDVYVVRIRAYMINGEYVGIDSEWSTITIRIPCDGSDGNWEIICRPVNLFTDLNVIKLDEEEVLVSDKDIKEE